MKRCTQLKFILLIFLISCNNKSEESEIKVTDTITTINTEDSTIHFTTRLLWEVDNEARVKKRNPLFQQSALHADSIIQRLNETYPNIKLEKIRISRDTLYGQIKDSEYFTQRIGTSGAANYLSDVIINLTAIPSIRYVSLDFEMGDHAMPGVWSSDDFADIKLVE